jgi:hypothetical protein
MTLIIKAKHLDFNIPSELSNPMKRINKILDTPQKASLLFKLKWMFSEVVRKG